MNAAGLIAWRQRLKLSKSEAARQLGMSRNGYFAYEAGASRIPEYIALACAALAFGLKPMK